LRDLSELQDRKRFDNNYSAVFSKFSQAFQDFILTLLHPKAASRVPGSAFDADCRVVRLFRKFPQLIRTGSIDEIIENATPSPTQSALLQVTRLPTCANNYSLINCRFASACLQFERRCLEFPDGE
jgi:hypothetical protein